MFFFSLVCVCIKHPLCYPESLKFIRKDDDGEEKRSVYDTTL